MKIVWFHTKDHPEFRASLYPTYNEFDKSGPIVYFPSQACGYNRDEFGFILKEWINPNTMGPAWNYVFDHYEEIVQEIKEQLLKQAL